MGKTCSWDKEMGVSMQRHAGQQGDAPCLPLRCFNLHMTSSIWSVGGERAGWEWMTSLDLQMGAHL
jgi:hypothetical protein